LAGGRETGRRVAAVIGGWGTPAAALSLAVMVVALSMRRGGVAQVAGTVFILAAVITIVWHVGGET
jgi:hypothetical protein